MKEIIKITEKDGQKAVNARELHEFLESKQDFSTWIKARIDKYGFVENQDFEVFHKIMENSQGGRPQIEYALSLDMAKELSMVENNEKGRMARKYFIECEKTVTNQTSLLEDKLKVIEFSAKFLNLNEASKLMMLKAITDPMGLPTPDYVNDKGIFHSASDLLARMVWRFPHRLSINYSKRKDSCKRYFATRQKARRSHIRISPGKDFLMVKTREAQTINQKHSQFGMTKSSLNYFPSLAWYNHNPHPPITGEWGIFHFLSTNNLKT